MTIQITRPEVEALIPRMSAGERTWYETLYRRYAKLTGAAGGTVVNVPITGVFTMHGTSRPETLSVQMRLAGSQIDAVGSLTFPWGRFDMTAPSVGGFVSVEPTATMEFDLRLARG